MHVGVVMFGRVGIHPVVGELHMTVVIRGQHGRVQVRREQAVVLGGQHGRVRVQVVHRGLFRGRQHRRMDELWRLILGQHRWVPERIGTGASEDVVVRVRTERELHGRALGMGRSGRRRRIALAKRAVRDSRGGRLRRRIDAHPPSFVRPARRLHLGQVDGGEGQRVRGRVVVQLRHVVWVVRAREGGGVSALRVVAVVRLVPVGSERAHELRLGRSVLGLVMIRVGKLRGRVGRQGWRGLPRRRRPTADAGTGGGGLGGGETAAVMA